MKTFECKFILDCLNHLEQILSNNHELDDAIDHFTEGKTSNPRYQLNSKIKDSDRWSDYEKLQLNAAVFEAIARTSTLFYKENTERMLEINTANTLFLEKYLPLLTENTKAINQLDAVKQNSVRIKTEIKRTAEASVENPYAFFTPVTAGLVVLAATAATVALLSRG